MPQTKPFPSEIWASILVVSLVSSLILNSQQQEQTLILRDTIL